MTISQSRLAPNEGQLREACELLRALAIVLKLADGLGMSQSLASQHLRVLLVTASRRGKDLYRLADDHVAHIARAALTPGGERGLRELPL